MCDVISKIVSSGFSDFLICCLFFFFPSAYFLNIRRDKMKLFYKPFRSKLRFRCRIYEYISSTKKLCIVHLSSYSYIYLNVLCSPCYFWDMKFVEPISHIYIWWKFYRQSRNWGNFIIYIFTCYNIIWD